MKNISQIKREAREEVRKESRFIKILIYNGKLIESTMDIPFKKGFVDIICGWLKKEVLNIKYKQKEDEKE